jgi:hypothetical protein
MVGNYALPEIEEMQASIAYDERRFLGHVVKTPRHTMQCDYDLYKVEIRKELQRGHKRAQMGKGRPRPGPRAHLYDDRQVAAE